MRGTVKLTIAHSRNQFSEALELGRKSLAHLINYKFSAIFGEQCHSPEMIHWIEFWDNPEVLVK